MSKLIEELKELTDLDQEMREYASKIIDEADETYNAIFPEKHDSQKIKEFHKYDLSLAAEAKAFYMQHFEKICRNETDYFFECCDHFNLSVDKFLDAKGSAAVSEAKHECRNKYIDLKNSVKGTILE